MSAARDLKPAPELRADLAGMAEALAQFAQREFTQAETAQPRIAVLVPCFNEEAAVATVVADFRSALPSAEIYVYDNNSSDRTKTIAVEAGAKVRSERRQGKGHVVRRMFADIDADIYVLVDGDATYDAASAPRMIERLVADHLDMVVGLRVDQAEAAYRRGHRTGNWMLTRFLSAVFGQEFKDILSGYRVFSRRFVKTFPVLSDGFEIETELSVHALELALPVAEIETPYYARPQGSFSKLNTWRDGFRILGTILKLYRSEKPLRFFTAIGIFLMLVSIGLAIPVVVTYLEQGLVPRLPTAVLSMGLMILAVLSVSSGLVLDTVTRGRREMKLLAYLSQPATNNTLCRFWFSGAATMDRAPVRCYPASRYERSVSHHIGGNRQRRAGDRTAACADVRARPFRAERLSPARACRSSARSVVHGKDRHAA